MRLAAFCIAIFVVSVLSIPVYSLSEVIEQGYFNFELPFNLILDGREITVKFRYDIKGFDMKSQKRLTVRPSITAGAVEIYNDALNRFVGVADFNSALPYLREEMTVRFVGIQSSESAVALKFVVHDNLTGQNYETPDKKVWGTAYYKDYSDLLNVNILATHEESEIAEVLPTDNKPDNPVKIYLWYLSPALFLYGLLKSPHGFG